MTTLAQMEQALGVQVFSHLVREAEVPLVSQLAPQGDVLVRRVSTPPKGLAQAAAPIPAAGYAVVRGEAGGNTHSLHGGGFFAPADAVRDDLILGMLFVPEGETSVLAHPEHGFLEIAPGTYEIRRQREYAGEWRMVAD